MARIFEPEQHSCDTCGGMAENETFWNVEMPIITLFPADGVWGL